MPKEPGEPSFEERKNSTIEIRDQMIEKASDFQQKAVELHGAKYQIAMLRIMEKSGDDVEILNALNKFLDALDARASRGGSGEAFRKPDKFAKFLNEVAEKLPIDG